MPHFCVNENDLETRNTNLLFCFIFFLWSQERCFIHAKNFHRNKLKLSSCILFGYLSSHCKNAVWCLANRESWMWNGVPEHALKFFGGAFQLSDGRGKKMETRHKKIWKNFTVAKIKCLILPLIPEYWNYAIPSRISLYLYCPHGEASQAKHRTHTDLSMRYIKTKNT